MALNSVVSSDDRLVRYSEYPEYHLLEFTGYPNKWSGATFCKSVINTLADIVDSRIAKPLLTRSLATKTYCSALDFGDGLTTSSFLDSSYIPVLRAFLEFPWPTIALIERGTSAAGFMVAVCQDHVIMNQDHGTLRLDELQPGASHALSIQAILRVKLGFHIAKQLFSATNELSGADAYALGVVDSLGDITDAIGAASNLGIFAQSPSYGLLRQGVFSEALSLLCQSASQCARYKL